MFSYFLPRSHENKSRSGFIIWCHLPLLLTYSLIISSEIVLQAGFGNIINIERLFGGRLCLKWLNNTYMAYIIIKIIKADTCRCYTMEMMWILDSLNVLRNEGPLRDYQCCLFRAHTGQMKGEWQWQKMCVRERKGGTACTTFWVNRNLNANHYHTLFFFFFQQKCYNQWL